MTSATMKSRIKEAETLSTLALFFIALTLMTHRFVFVYIAMGLLISDLFIRPLSRKITHCWQFIAEVLGVVNSRVILTIVYYFCLTPIALVFRFFNKKSTDWAFLKDKESNFIVRDHAFAKEDLEKMW